MCIRKIRRKFLMGRILGNLGDLVIYLCIVQGGDFVENYTTDNIIMYHSFTYIIGGGKGLGELSPPRFR